MTKGQEIRVIKILLLAAIINISLLFLSLPVGLKGFISGLGLGLLILKIK